MAAFLDALEELRGGPAATAPRCQAAPRCRGCQTRCSRGGLEVADGRLSFVAQAPEPRLVTGSVALDVARLALSCGKRAVPAFLDALEHAVELGLSALAAQEALLPAAGARAALRAVTGLSDTALTACRRLALCGFDEAACVLLGDGTRARANRLDLAAATGERIAEVLGRRRRTSRCAWGAQVPRRASASRLDLQAFADARDRLPLATHREASATCRLLAAAPTSAAGNLAARAAQLLGLSPDGSAPAHRRRRPAHGLPARLRPRFRSPEGRCPMRLTRVEIHGFKSFADRVQLDLPPGLTAVVGPNGCGKSNVIDAIKWALGEQRASALRGDEMLDVIFKGNGARAARNFAEVSLHFDNASRTLPIDFSEVVVTRRLFRSGESEYLINKQPQRLKDVRTC